MRRGIAAAIATVCTIWNHPAGAADLAGPAQVIDGDTIKIDGPRVRLHGIDAPEGAQTCLADGTVWHCGQDTTLALEQEIGRHSVACRETDRDHYTRIVAVCHVGPYDLGARMVFLGWALAYRQFSDDYMEEEGAAREAGTGIWRGQFVWRQGIRLAQSKSRSNKLMFIDKGLGWALAYRQFSDDYMEEQAERIDEDNLLARVIALRVERAAREAGTGIWRGQFVPPWEWRQGIRLAQSKDRSVVGECLIKGNVGRDSERIYHVPGGAYYGRTKIDPSKGGRWFCTEDEARAAGWRRSKR